MEFYHVLGPVFAIIAMLFWANAMVKREKGVEYKIGPRLFVIAMVVVFHWFFTDSNIWDKLALLCLDFGIGMIVNIAYLAYHKAFPKVFLGLGITALAVSGALFGLGKLVGLSWDPVDRDVATSILVEIGPDDDVDELYAVFEEFEADFEEAYPMVSKREDEDLSQTYEVWVAPERVNEFMNELRKDKENVDFVEKNITFSAIEPVGTAITPTRGPVETEYGFNDPGIAHQWWLTPSKSKKMFQSLKKMDPNKKAVVAILDTGVDSDHEDMKGVFGKSPAKKDKQGHGTHCAGLAGAESNNGKGIASLNYKGKFIQVKGYQALSDNGSGTMEQISENIIKAAKDGADVISMSLGGPSPFKPRSLDRAIQYARAQGSIVVVAAGNSNRDAAKGYYPAAIDGVICVAATNSDNNRASFSNWNSSLKMPISAPGQDIYSLKTGGGYVSYNGTSMATPIVAGMLGFMRAMDPNVSEADAYKLLKKTGINPKKEDKIGKIVQPDKLVEAMK